MVYTLRFFSPLQSAVCFIILKYLVPVLFTFYIQGVLKLKKIMPAPKVKKRGWRNINGCPTLEPSGKQEERETEKWLEKIGNVGSG